MLKQAKSAISMVLTVLMLLSNLTGLTFAATSEESTETTEPTSTTENTEVTEVTSQQGTQVTNGDFTFTVLNGTYCEVTLYHGTDAVVEIPFEYEGFIVQSIASNSSCFVGLPSLNLVMPAPIKGMFIVLPA